MKIGLTGSIACGKSTVSAYLRSKGYFVADADAVSRALTADGGAALPRIRAEFGDGVFSGESLDRKAMAALVFSDPARRAALNAILHPMIQSEIARQLEAHASQEAPVFADIPLLYECGWEDRFDAVWVVSASPETQIARLAQRDGMTEAQARARIDAQMSSAEKERRADRVIRSEGTISRTQAQVDALLAELASPSPARRRRPSAPPRAPSAAPDRTPELVRLSIPDTKVSPGARIRRQKRRHFVFLPGAPRPVRAAVLILAAFLLLSVCTIVTRNWLDHVAEQRRLEAEAAERARHPLHYAQWIDRYCAQRGLDPSLISAIILCESSYNPQAESRLGARGLMQLMPDTAEWIAHKLGEDGPEYSFDLLYDPETNIRFGTWYLSFLSNRFDGDPTKIVCAYHAGQGNVAAWLQNPDYSADGVTLDVIPTADTAAYCRRVLNAREVYIKYYYPTPTPEPEPTPGPV